MNRHKGSRLQANERPSFAMENQLKNRLGMKRISLNRAICKIVAGAFLLLGPSLQGEIVSGDAAMVAQDVVFPNGLIYDQVLMTGQQVAVKADEQQVTRVSLVDINGDIIQIEFSGSGLMEIILDSDTFEAAAPATKYNQDQVSYVTGHPTVILKGTGLDTNLNIYSIGRATAFDHTIFIEGELYDGVADVRLVQISGGSVERIMTGNVRFSSINDFTGIFAPFTGVAVRAVIGDIDAAGEAIPVLQLSESSSLEQDSGALLIAGGDLRQTNGSAIDVALANGVASLLTVGGIRSDGTSLERQEVALDIEFLGGDLSRLFVNGDLRFEGDGLVVEAPVRQNFNPRSRPFSSSLQY